MTLTIWGVTGIPEVRAGDDLASLIAEAVGAELQDGDVVVVTSKVVSKAEGRVTAGDREAAIDAETVRVVARRGGTRIVETRHGLVLAAAGVDASNVPAGHVALLPVDPDASAHRIRVGLRERLRIDVGVLVTDTLGRPWREGLTDVAIGAAGFSVLRDYRGLADGYGNTLELTQIAEGDEIAAAAELVKGKLGAVPIAVVRGLDVRAPDPDHGVRPLVRAAEADLFRYGSAEAVHAAVNGQAVSTTGADVGAVLAAVAAHHPCRFAVDGDDVVVTLVEPPRPDVLVQAGITIGRLLVALSAEGLTGEWVPDRDTDHRLGLVRVGKPPSPPHPPPHS